MTHALLFAGVAAIVYGVWAIYHPAGFIAGGLLASATALLIDRLKDKGE